MNKCPVLLQNPCLQFSPDRLTKYTQKPFKTSIFVFICSANRHCVISPSVFYPNDPPTVKLSALQPLSIKISIIATYNLSTNKKLYFAFFRHEAIVIHLKFTGKRGDRDHSLQYAVNCMEGLLAVQVYFQKQGPPYYFQILKISPPLHNDNSP